MSDEGFIPVRIPADCKPPELAAASAFLTAAKSKQQVRLKDGRGFIAWFLFISLCVALIMLLKANDRSAKPPAGNEPPTAQVRTPADVRVAFVLLLAGVACIVGGIVQLRWARRLPGRWHGQKFYRFSEDGVTVERPGRRDHYRWPRFVRLDETPDLLLLGCEPYQALVFPKRLFADEAEVARVKELLQKRLTRAAIPQAHGFPVQPVQPVQPAHGEETARTS